MDVTVAASAIGETRVGDARGPRDADPRHFTPVNGRAVTYTTVSVGGWMDGWMLTLATLPCITHSLPENTHTHSLNTHTLATFCTLTHTLSVHPHTLSEHSKSHSELSLTHPHTLSEYTHSICLSGRVPPTSASVNLDTSGYSADLTLWPEFHNGVAAGLRSVTLTDGDIVRNPRWCQTDCFLRMTSRSLYITTL